MKNLVIALIFPFLIRCRNFDWDALQGKRPGPATPISSLNIPQPVYAPPQGLFKAAQSVTISSTIPRVTLCYTVNGSQPECDLLTATCTNGSKFSAPLAIATTSTLKSVACKAGQANSPVASGLFSIDLTPPAAASSFTASAGDSTALLSWVNPGDADFSRAKLVRKAPTPPANSADGTVIYEGTGSAFADLGLANGTTYYYAVFAYDLAGHESAAATASASPLGGLLNAPTYVPAAGTYNLPLSATISSANTGDIICYTTNGSTPACDATPTCTTGALASGSVTVAASQTLKAISCKTGSPVSAVAPAAYTIDMTAPVFSGLLPVNGASVSSAQLSYSLSETCVTGSVTWTRTGGSADAGSPHTSALTMSELLAGSQSAITLVNTPPLVQGAIYDIGFSCSDAAGNNSPPALITDVIYDASPPAALSAFRAIAGDGRITLVWNNPGDLDLAGVKILRKTGGWLDSDSGSSGMRGTQNSATAAAWSNGINSCNAPRSIYCVEQ